MSIRKLASVQVISNLRSIEGADRIELARILGWNVVVKKGDFKVGDKVIYFETDSILPENNPAFDFLKNSKGKIKPLKAKRIRGIVSQGLVTGLDVIPLGKIIPLDVGFDCTEILGVKKYDPIEVVFRNPKGNYSYIVSGFPYFIPKTEETRVQILQDKLDIAKNHKFVITEKLDGSSITCFIKDGKFGVCSRNNMVSLTISNPWGEAALKYDLENKFTKLREALGYDFALQGELIGVGIQGNKYNLSDYEIRWFNLFRIDKQEDVGFYHSDQQQLNNFNGFTLGEVASMLDMETVPVLDVDFDMNNNIDTLVMMAQGKSKLNPNQNREGIVFRAKYNKEFNKVGFGCRFSFKAINPDFLCP